MYEEIKVSIVVPIYNVEKYLDKLINSLIIQSHRNIEIILVDDGSPDKCGEICDKYALSDDRILVIHQKNAGGGKARNSGLDIATGEYIMFVDGDDWIADDCVDYLLNLAVSTNSEMSLSIYNFTTRDLNPTDEELWTQIWTPEEVVVAIFRPLFAVGCWNKLYKIDVVRKNHIRFDVPWFGEGLYFSSMMASVVNHIGVGNKKVYYYRMNNPTSATTFFRVSNARNAIWNSTNLKKKIPIKTDNTKWAINQHIRNNYYEAIRILLGRHKIIRHLPFFLLCWMKLIIYTPIVIKEGEYSNRQIKSLIRHALLPCRYARKDIRFMQEKLKKDKVE